MFDLGWDEMALIAVVALVVLGPKELPNALRTVSGLMRQARKLANEFQSGVHQIIREAELEDAKKAIADLNKGTISDAIEKHLDADGEIKSALTPPVDEPVNPAAINEKPAAEIAGPALPETPALPTTEINPAVAAFAPGGSATRLPGVDEAGVAPVAELIGEAAPLIEGDPRETPVEGGPGNRHDDDLRQAAASTLAVEGDEAIKKIKLDQEVSKTS
ncbi:MAG TPA: Sec-independent protein translocase protein TatB [Dongiaceae bacterium]|nr:Sec-independent protein translocase protein TatB [Dongiaceae bacterium]